MNKLRSLIQKSFRYCFVMTLFGMLCSRYAFPQLPGMHSNGRYLFSAKGDTVILKGFNAMIVYWDIHGDVNFPEIEKTGANCVRIFWNLAAPAPQPSDLDKALGNCISHHMIPIICLWDATGKWDKIQTCVDYWCSFQIAPVLKKYEKLLIINIANEPGDHDMGGSVFQDTYSTAIKQMRNSGLHMPLMVDADRWGRNADAVLDNGQYLLDHDPDHNLLFSWHLWDPYNLGTGTVSEIDRIIAKAVDKNICFIVGEFGPCEQTDNCSNTLINWEYLIEKAYKNNIGYLPWVWKWNDCHSIVDNSTGSYGSWTNSSWGENVAVQNIHSIQNTSRRPSDLLAGINVAIKQQLNPSNPPEESVFLHTDRTDYSAGESVFFKAYLLHDKPVLTNPQDENLYVALADQEGVEVASGKFIVKNSISSGYLELSRFLTEGNYILMGFADLMKNTSPVTIFSRIIEVKKSKKSGIETVIKLNDTLYAPGSQLTANISVSGENDKPLSASFIYRLQGSEGEINSGKGKTNDDGKATLKIELPSFQTDDTLKLMLTSSYKGASSQVGIVIPTPGNRRILRSYIANKIAINKYKDLNIRIKTDKLQYSSGEKVNVNINVTNDQGIPVVAHLSVSASNPDPHPNLLNNYEVIRGKEMFGVQMGINELWRNVLYEMQPKTLPETVITEVTDKQEAEGVFNPAIRKFFADCLYKINHSPGCSFMVQEKNDRKKITKKQVPVNQRGKYGYQADMKITDIIYHIKPFQLEGDKIVFANSGANSFYFQDGALIVIDGIKMGTDAGILNTLPVTDIAKINVFTNPSDIQRYTGLNNVGIIEITTKKGNEEAENKSPVHEFISGALLWEPDILTDMSGNASISFSNSKSAEVIISVAGTGGDGLAGISSIQIPVN